MLRDGWRMAKIFSLYEMSKDTVAGRWSHKGPLGLWNPLKWKNGGKLPLLHWSSSWQAGKAVSPLGLAAVASAWCCRWGGNVLHSSDLGWQESPARGCLLCSWVKYWLVRAHLFCNSNFFHACLKIHLHEAQVNLMTQCPCYHEPQTMTKCWIAACCNLNFYYK